jgi:hypothetical protein
MTASNLPHRDHPLVCVLVLAGAAAVAAVSARDYAGSWNDRSRLATVECLVDYHTLAIDGSVFAQDAPPQGTGDKLLIDGHYYSDKSPVPALLMAGLYRAWQWPTGLTARARPDRFCYFLTVGTSGLAYVAAVWCLFRLGRPLRLPPSLRLALAASFALATVALPYARHVNNHLLLLGVAAPLMLSLARLAEEAGAGRFPWPRLAGLGSLAGLAYTIDLGAGPVLLLCLLGLVAYRCRRWRPVVVFLLAALPWLALHHAVNYAVGGTLKPANAVPEYFEWPGSPFNAQNLTGGWNHGSVGHFLTYAAALLAGKRGFLGHNLPLFLALPGIVFVLRRRTAELPEVVFAGCWCGGTWLLYALTSTNYSGQCCSIRWFVPLLAPAYYVLAVFLRDWPSYRWDFLFLSGWGAVLARVMWEKGPWMQRLVPYFWPVVAAALVSWAVCRAWRGRLDARRPASRATEAEQVPKAA